MVAVLMGVMGRGETGWDYRNMGDGQAGVSKRRLGGVLKG